jgi:hypothetical protein
MLDLGAVKRQIDVMVADRKLATNDYADRVDRAVREWERWKKEDPTILTDKVARAKTSWLVGRPIEPAAFTGALPGRPPQLTVIATDGSQIFPDRNEVASCFLVNLGYVVITYGTGERPILDSEPLLFYEDEDLYQEWSGRKGMVTREQVGQKRMAMEFEKLTQLADAEERDHPIVALSDGTLILWMLEGKPLEFRRSMLRAFLSAMDRLQALKTPVCGYISDPGGSDVINALRVGMCPENPTNCDRCPWQVGDDPVIPCEPIAGVTDAVLFKRVLQPGERSALFESASKILDDYGPHRIVFFYVNTGSEVGRVEIPMWVARDEALLNLVHATVVDQCRKGRGYPVVLSESHEQAVVRGADRDMFYTFLRDAFVKSHLPADVSVKQLTKQVVDV